MGLNKRLIGAGATASGALTPSENFKAFAYAGDGASTRAITNIGFKPDVVWILCRTTSHSPKISDSSRGSTKYVYTNQAQVEQNFSTSIKSFDDDGFTLGSETNSNQNGQDYVAWCWKSNGGTTSSNSDGSTTSTVQASPAAGVSIIQYTGTGNNASVGHGLSSPPELILIKKLNAATDWTAGALDWTKYLELNGTPPFRTANVWQNTAPTSTVFTLATGGDSNGNGDTMIAYAFHSVDGFSKIGNYDGNGSTNGTTVETGFEPAFVLIKNTTSTDNWIVFDNARNTTNPRTKAAITSSSGENTEAGAILNFYSNGFQSVGTGGGAGSGGINASGDTYIYMAFASDPDTEAPTLASSFNIETYTGSGAAKSITGTGFLPNLVWIKDRDTNFSHALTDSVRGVGNIIKSNSTDAQSTDVQTITSFDSNGFSIGTAGGSFGNNGDDYVAWTWKADDNEPTAFFNSVVTGVYKFEDNVNDVAGNNNGANGVDIAYTSSGKFNKAVISNGTNTSLSLSQTPPMTTAWTFSFWFYATESDSNIRVILQTGTGFAIGLELSKIYIFTGGSNRGSGTSISLNTWYHYAATYDGTSVKTYLNGSLAETITTLTGMSVGNLKLFDPPYGSWAHYTGRLDQLRVYSTGLSSTQITALYNESASDNDTVEFPTGLPNGSVSSIVSANANAGFSIVQFTNNNPGEKARIFHGLSATPNMIILKRTDGTENWYVYHSSMGLTKFMRLDLTDAQGNATNLFNTVNSTVFNPSFTGTTGQTCIAYCFHDVAGYQKFGTYTGTGATGNTVALGFKPDFVMVKSSSTTEPWFILDSKRDTGNPRDNRLMADSDAVEDDGSVHTMNFNSTSFTLNGTTGNGTNGNGQTYIYWAIAKNVPSNTTLANSFKAVIYSGDATNNRAIDVGFQPDMVWLKTRNQTNDHNIIDTIRGVDKQVRPNRDIAEVSATDLIKSFTSTGFTLGTGGDANASGNTYVAWAWKAGNTWQSNIDGSSGSIVNVNTANGFSIVKYVGNQTAGHTIGHGLGAVPQVIILKCLDVVRPWYVYHVGVDASNPSHYNLRLNAGDARQDSQTEFNDTEPTSTVFTLGTASGPNGTGSNYIAYCWTPKSGYSKFGSYSGNGSTGQTIPTGFKPDFVMIKSTNNGSDWYMIDSVRPNNKFLVANGTTEYTASDTHTFVDTGFTLSGESYNNSGYDWIYMAFKMN